MSDILEFVLKMKDMMSNPLREVAAVAQKSFGSAQGVASSFGMKASAAVHRVASQTRYMSSSVDELRHKLERVNQIRFGTVLRSEFRAASREAQSLERQISRLENRGSSRGGSSGGSGILGSIVGGNLITGAIMQGFSFAKDQAVDTYQTGKRIGGLKTAINSTTGGQGKEAVSMTSAIADKYGLNYEASLEGVKTLTGGLKSMNMPLKEQMRIFEGVSTGIAAMKLGAEESKGAMLALGQMASKGTVSAEELRGQLGERIPGAFGIAAKAMNMTESELGKMMQKGEIAAKDFLPRFAAEMQKTFGADALEASKGPQAVEERWNNAILKVKETIGSGLTPVITPIIEKFTQLAIDIMPSIQRGVDWVVNAFSGISGNTEGWVDYLSIAKDFLGGVWNNAKGILGNVGSILSGMISWIGRSEILKDIFSATSTVLGKVWDVLTWVSEKLKWLWDSVLKPILDGIESAYRWVKELVGKDSTIEIKHTTGDGKIPFVPNPSNAPNTIGQPLVTTFLYQKPQATESKLKSTSGSNSSGKADGISGGGPRVININITNLMNGTSINSTNIKEGVGELGRIIQEEVRRVLYSAAAAQ